MAGRAVSALSVAPAAFLASLDGVPQPITLTGSSWSMAAITKKGGHALTITALDPAGNVRQVAVSFKITGGK